MKRKSEAEQDSEFKVGQHVRLDRQPFAWQIVKLNYEGFKNRVKIETRIPQAIVPRMSQVVDTYRLTPLTDEEVADIRQWLKTPLEERL